MTLGMRREIAKNRPTDRPRNFYEYGSFQSREVTLSIWACNARHQEAEYTLQISAYDLATDWRAELPSKSVRLGENRSTELFSGDCPQPPRDKAYDQLAPSGTVVVQARLVDGCGAVVARFSDWPQPYKLLDLPDPGLDLKVGKESEGHVEISVKKPAKGVWLSVMGDDEGVEFDDNSLDLFPGDVQMVKARGIEGKTLTAAWLGSERAAQA